ncbi:MAG: DUF928 domain-containing protein [Xenococcus sp. (in: cyanobacteria)]
MNRLGLQSLFGTTITCTIILTANIAQANLSYNQKSTAIKNNLVALEFEPPDDATPKTSVGSGVRGNVQFTLPVKNTNPNTSVGSGVRGNVQFTLPGNNTNPKTTVGSGVRGDVQFTLPGNNTNPKTTVGSGVRGDVQFTLPDQNTNPKTTVGSGVRGQEIPLTALVPTSKFGRTASVRPTIFVYLPPIGAQEVFFSIQDEAGNFHYYSMLKVPPTGGVITIPLPESAPELELGNNYLWYFAPIKPGGILRPDNYAVTGWVKRVETNINQQQLVSSPIQLATEYAKAGIWYNTLEVLVAAQSSDPNNTILRQEWQDLLKQVGLEAIASQPIAEVSSFPVDNNQNLLKSIDLSK